MPNRPIFKLGSRLKTCANFVTMDSRIVDVGTDHAYLPIWLAKSNIVKFAIASDLREGPLIAARANINKYNVQDKVEARLSDGLSKIDSDEIDEVIIAGMGGELIIDIISKSLWIKDKKLILQPMTSSQKLREFLEEKSIFLTDEKVVEEDGKIYSVMYIKPNQNNVVYNDLYPYIGLITNNMDGMVIKYIKKEIKHLNNKIKGLVFNGKYIEASLLRNVVDKLNRICNEEN